MTTHKTEKQGMNKMLLILGAALVVIVLIVGGFMFMNKKSATPVDNTDEESVAIKTISPDEIGLTLTPEAAKNSIVLEADKLDGIESLEYEVNYNAKDANGDDIPRGVIGDVEVGGKSNVSRDIYLGTCSSGTCKPDKGVEKAEFVIKVNYTSGDVAQITQTVSLSK